MAAREVMDEVARLSGGEPLVKGGRRMGGMYLVDPEQPEAAIAEWLSLAVGNAMSQPAK